jgi:GT2 family glycosyltransferase
MVEALMKDELEDLALWEWAASLPFEHHQRRRAASEAVSRWITERGAYVRATGPEIVLLLHTGPDPDSHFVTLMSWAAQTWPGTAWGIVGEEAEPWADERAARGIAAPKFCMNALTAESSVADSRRWCLVAKGGDLLHPSLAGVIACLSRTGAEGVFWDRLISAAKGSRRVLTERWRGPASDEVADACADFRGPAFALPSHHWVDYSVERLNDVRSTSRIARAGWIHHAEPLCIRDRDSWPSPVRGSLHTAGIGAVRQGRLSASSKVSVIVLYRDKPELTLAALESVLAQTIATQVELVLVDNDSEPRTRASVASFIKAKGMTGRTRLVDFPGAFNHSLQCNLGAERASGDILCFLNNDARFLQPDALEALATRAAFPGVASVGPRLVDSSGQTVGGGFRARREPGAEFNSPVEEERGAAAMLDRTTFGNSFACAAIERVRFFSLGGLDPVLFPVGYNDVDFCLRAFRSGLSHVTLGTIRVEHNAGSSRARMDEIAQKLVLRRQYPEVSLHALWDHDWQQLPPREFPRSLPAGLRAISQQ